MNLAALLLDAVRAWPSRVAFELPRRGSITFEDLDRLSDDVARALEQKGVKPGEYMFPCADSMKDMGTPKYIEKCNLGPVGHMIILPNGPWNMTKSLVQWFLFSVLVSIFTAYVANFSLAPGAGFGAAMRLAGTVATVGYAFSNITNSIWKGVRWSVTAKFVFDGVLYGLTTGVLFGCLWPDAV